VVCFTIEASMTALDSSVHYIFRDGTGQQVATGIYRLSSSSFEVTCDGVFPVQLTRSCMEIASAGSDCVTGACTF
jgi:hypothetical protein